MQFFNEIIGIISKYWQMLLKGLGYTMLIALVGTLVGLVIGLLTGVLRTIPKSKNTFLRILQKIMNFIIAVYVEIFRGTPMMVQAMVIFWGYALLAGGNTLPVIGAGLFIVSINTGAYMAEIVRGGIMSIDKGQFEGAHAIGMNHFQTMFYVVLPQAIRNILPSVANEFIINIKDTSVLNVIGVAELYYNAYMIQTMNYKIFQTYVIVSVMYFAMTFTVSRLLRLLEKAMNGKNSYVVLGSQSDPAAEIRVKEAE
ncbi:MAG: amino acid ABC transporter permease [Clostridia bacterium]|nr:amino acid ABC transporter permease [Clostridia bacterium]MBQ9481047.1 amino acid ABC transporter permease [Clostridia bacterium]